MSVVSCTLLLTAGPEVRLLCELLWINNSRLTDHYIQVALKVDVPFMLRTEMARTSRQNIYEKLKKYSERSKHAETHMM